ncbi:MAG: cation transporter [Bdellovibrionales bacterium RIFOXYD12_FULL_39_22]|nr:MAG: cation transporter [Bdellovibrionales bacterium RIFOXYB1_FULL_39_21]OFZ40465.1 MAG: cation transporter [Bdellovibrionales bacterium RIFOXYC12_FULL_39_17]OFZ49948.1 MAG: cation transporter [Bdellovibrionales bacterium RIFOXYC1_FULL_39_130]OFZ77590.1 MAG: cation transporter [Bdellovibrionales bacterium RIFOXYD1_FULL_39_84]OFZ96044.1 MAG: cation transporter [Bdellovibrionales bacterium RIFOXYD12_FULL_39_22]HLE10667.1 CusA/CzcA family heavy metal efflux RND transporter [Bacteriovoracaceae 
MIEKIIELSARNRFMVIMLVAVAAMGGWYALQQIPVDAIPDLSDTQVIIYSKWDRGPDIIEDQVTYPIISALLGAPKVKDIRGFSDFGLSYIYVIFEDGTDIYWARSRVLEYLSQITSDLPSEVRTQLGPDATGVGWVYQYALVDKSGQHSLPELRALQDWYLKFHLQTVPGVAEVAALGGFQKQYQIQINPNALLAYNISLSQVVSAVKEGNNDVGARLLEIAGAEYMIRGRGQVKNLADIEKIIVGNQSGTPVYVRQIATVTTGPEMRRGVADLDGEGDVVSGIIVMRFGENATRTIDAVKAKLTDLKRSLPPGVEIVTTYDRSDLVKRAITTLTHELTLEMIIVSFVILIFLLHIPSAMIPIITLPLAVLISFIPMKLLGISSNIMSLGGIAIAVGAMVDAAIVVVENAHKHLEEWEKKGSPGDVKKVIIDAIKEVGPASFYSLLVIAVSFVPIFALEAQEGRLFKPLAYTKNLSMFVAAFLSITLDPALRVSLAHFSIKHFRPTWLANIRNTILVGKMYSEEEHPISKFFFKFYGPIVDWCVVHHFKVMLLALLAMILTVPIFFKIGQEFMPPLNEGTILYMPTTMPGISIASAHDLLKRQDSVLKSFPEVERVLGKAGRAETSTDPAPFSMMETTVVLRPQNEWREKKRWYSSWPKFLQYPLTLIWPPFMSWEELVAEMDAKTKFPGTTNAWTMPIRNRIDMLTTGIRTPVGIKVLGGNLAQIEKIGLQIEKLLPQVPGTRSVFAERATGGYFLDFHFNREKMARFGITIGQAQETLMTAVGGDPISKTIEGRERYSISVRYSRDFRSDIEALKKVLVASPNGAQIPLGELADIEMMAGPSMLRNENGMLGSYVYVDVAKRDIGSYVAEAKKVINQKIKLPTGVALVWSGQFENMARAWERLQLIIPITLFVICMLLYANTKSWPKTAIILMAVPFSAVGAIWILYLLGYNFSIAVWVGLIALLGVDAETGIFMLLYLDLAYESAKKEGRMINFENLKAAISFGAVKRVRPKIMTVSCLIMALLPIMWASTANAGADVMKRIAAPMLGGIVTSFAMELMVYPAIFAIWKWYFEVNSKTELT